MLVTKNKKRMERKPFLVHGANIHLKILKLTSKHKNNIKFFLR